MAQVSIVMGSDSDMPVMAKAAEILDKFGISYEMRIISAHRMPDTFFEYAQTAEERGVLYFWFSTVYNQHVVNQNSKKFNFHY